MRFIMKKHSRYDNCMSAEIKLFKTKYKQYTLQEFYDPHYLELRKWIRGKDDMLFVLNKWWQIPLNRYCINLFKSDPNRRKVPGNIRVIANNIRKNKKEDNDE